MIISVTFNYFAVVNLNIAISPGLFTVSDLLFLQLSMIYKLNENKALDPVANIHERFL